MASSQAARVGFTYGQDVAREVELLCHAIVITKASLVEKPVFLAAPIRTQKSDSSKGSEKSADGRWNKGPSSSGQTSTRPGVSAGLVHLRRTCGRVLLQPGAP